jgi:excisionase family DNA binding protein
MPAILEKQRQSGRPVQKAEALPAMLGLSLSSVVRLINDGTLPHVKVRGSVLIPQQAILDLVPSTTNTTNREVTQ